MQKKTSFYLNSHSLIGFPTVQNESLSYPLSHRHLTTFLLRSARCSPLRSVRSLALRARPWSLELARTNSQGCRERADDVPFLPTDSLSVAAARGSGHVPVCGLECAEGKHAEIGVL